MRRFSADYLANTRRGLWEDRSALTEADLVGRERILEVGCGSGEFTLILREETDAEIVALDADGALLRRVSATERIQGDATRLPVADDSFDLVIGQTLLVNLPSPETAVAEFCRVSNDLVVCIEPDNRGVTVTSTVDAEADLAARARRTFMSGIDTDVGLGHRTADLFERAGLRDVSVRYHPHRLSIQPPYSDAAVSGAAKKARASRLDEHRETMLQAMDEDDFDTLRADWREMGRQVVEQMRNDEYVREEVTPFYVTVGSV